jgi:hypothetical protein
MPSKSQHSDGSMQLTQNQNNQMSDDPKDGSRNSDRLGREGAKTPMERSPEEEAQDQSQIEAFGEEGAGVAAKE